MHIKNIAAKAARMENVGDLFVVVKELVEYLVVLDNELDDILHHLNSDNIEEIDFARTHIKNLKIGGGADENS